MTTRRRLQSTGFAVALACSIPWMVATQGTRGAVPIDADDIGGVVASAKGPEAGVWVIAETTDLPTKFARIVVTDDQGRYVLPDMPKATYNVWVRGYGLVDSPKVDGVPGKALNLTAVVAPTPQAAAQYYPPNYWLSIMQLPEGPDQARAGAAGRCGLACHQMGGKATREITPEMVAVHGPFKSTADAWLQRVRTGPTGAMMSTRLRTARAEDLSGLDRPHPGGGRAEGTAAAEGRGAQLRRQPVGLGRRQRLRARSGTRRSAQSRRPARHTDLRTRTEPRHPHLVRSDQSP